LQRLHPSKEGQVDVSYLEGKVFAFYFSGHWCPPCRGFTPKLAEWYTKSLKDKGLEIVFVSSDQTPEDMNSYMKEAHGDWMAVEHNSDVSNKLSEKYGVSGIPCLVVVKKDGTLVTKEGRSGVTSMAPAQAVAAWKK